MGDRTPGEYELETIDLGEATTPPAGKPRLRPLIVLIGVAVLSASVSIAATLAVTHRTRGDRPASRGAPPPVATSTSTGSRGDPYSIQLDGWIVAPDVDPPARGPVPGRIRFGLVDLIRGRRAGAGAKWLVVNVAITNTRASARRFDVGTMVELNAYELKIYGIDPTALDQFRSPIRPHATVRRAFLFRVPASITGMYLTVRSDLDTATARGQAGAINLTCC